MAKPLDGIRVFDITLAGVGPWSAKLLGELGADVIHVEAPGRSPMAIPPMFGGTSILYVAANSNKRCIVLDLKEQKDRQAAYSLIRSCDVFVENMRPGVMERLGLDYESLSKVNPDLVYVSASGYGQTGHMVPRPGADPQLQAFSGWDMITGTDEGGPEFFRHFAHLDYNTSQYIVQAVLMALFARARGNGGQKIEVAMLAAAMSLQSSRIAEYLATKQQPKRMGHATTSTVPQQAFLCEDRRWLAVGVTDDSQWAPFCEAIGRADLAQDVRYSTNRERIEHREELVPILESHFATKPVRWWEIRLTEAVVPQGRFLSWNELRFHPQVLENAMMQHEDTQDWGHLYHEGVPWQFSKCEPITYHPAPAVGEHTEQVRAEIAKMDAAAPATAPAGAKVGTNS